MTATYTPGSSASRDRVRLLIPDKTITGLTPSGGVYTLTSYLFTDEEIADLLATEDQVKRVVALALETIASDSDRLQAISGYGYSLDTTKTAATMLERAARLRAQADDDDYAVEGTFDIAEQVPTAFAARERIEKQRLRGVL